jgi:hypothetical protein
MSEQTTAEETTKPRNVYQRKLAVMERCGNIEKDDYNGYSAKTGKEVHFKYIGVQTLSNYLRKALVEEGLDVEFSFEEGQLLVSLVNVDEPSDRIVTRWPIVDQDKGYAYSTKYPLIRLFQVGDNEEGDEAELAERSGKAASALKKDAPAPSRGPVNAPAPASALEAMAKQAAPRITTPANLQALRERASMASQALMLTDDVGVETSGGYLDKLAQKNFKQPFTQLRGESLEKLVSFLEGRIASQEEAEKEGEALAKAMFQAVKDRSDIV